jgi:hypothetical protein
MPFAAGERDDLSSFYPAEKGLSAQTAKFSWMAEETLLGEVDTLHWTVLNKKGQSGWWPSTLNVCATG